MAVDTSATLLTRRALLTLGGAVAGVSLLAACAPAPPSPSAAPAPAPAGAGQTPPPGAAAAKAAPATAAKDVTLTWITPAEIGLERDFYTQFSQQFEQANPGMKVQVSFEAWSDYFTKLPTIFAGGTIPDMIHLHASIVQEYGLRGTVRNLFEYMQRDGISKDVWFPFLIEQMSDYKTKQSLWALPKDSAVYAFYYNKDAFDKAGVPYPKSSWTFDEFRQTAKLVTLDKNGNNAASAAFDPNAIVQWGVNWGDNPTDTILPGSDQWQATAWGHAGSWFSDDLSKAYFDDPDHVDFLQQIVDMRCKDHAIPMAGDSMGQGNAWRNGLVAMTIAHHSQVFFYNAEKKAFKFDVTPAPVGKNGQFDAAGCSGWAIPVKSQHPDEAWEFIKFLTNENTQCTIVKAKRWGSAIKPCEDNLLPEDNNPPNFKEVLYSPMLGQSSVKTQAIAYPPLLSEMRQVWKNEFDAVFNCGGGQVAEAARSAQPQIQAILDKAAHLT